MDEPNRRQYPGEEPYYSSREKIRPPQFGQRLLPFFIVATTVLLVIVVVFGIVIVHLLTTPSQNSHPSVSAPSVVITPAQQLATPVPTPSPTPTPTVASSPVVGTVLCHVSTGQWTDWQPTSGGWILNGGQLINDGTAGNSSYGINLTPPSECQPTIPDYSVQATITLIGNTQHVNFLLFVRGDGSGGKGYALGTGNNGDYGSYVEAIFPDGYSSFDILKGSGINPPSQGSQLTYTAKVVGIHLSLSISGYPPLSVDDARFLNGEQIGIYAGSQLQLDSFSVTVA